MTGEAELKIARRDFAKRITSAVRVTDTRIEDAFADVRREDFLGPGPWPVFDLPSGGYVPSADADPIHLYTDDLFGISPDRQINNGQPTLHAYLLGCAKLQEGEHAVHVGAGVGYYSAIMAHLVGPSGRVTAIEFEPDLAARARANFAAHANVTVVEGDGSVAAFSAADVIYVNAGATRPADAWLDRLKDGGRLILPLTTDKGFSVDDLANMQRRGAVFLITRTGETFQARWIAPVAIYPCAGMRDEASEKALVSAFQKEDVRRVTRLYRTGDIPDERCWLKAPDWCLAYD